MGAWVAVGQKALVTDLRWPVMVFENGGVVHLLVLQC